MPNQLFAMSINPKIIDKPTEDTLKLSGRGWHDVSVTLRDFVSVVESGTAFAPQFRGGVRRTANYLRTHMIAIDVDDGPAIEDACDNIFIRQNAAFIYTTCSHSIGAHRYRVVFLCDRAIESAKKWKAALLAGALKLGGDTTIKDGARMFFANRNAAVHEFGNTLPNHELAELIRFGTAALDAKSSRRSGAGPIALRDSISGETMVRRADGGEFPLAELAAGASVHCPKHTDSRPSALVVRSRKGVMGVACSACGVTFWSGALDDYDFDAFDKLVASRGNLAVPRGLEAFFPPNPSITEVSTRFLGRLLYRPGITMVKSPKGSGKTVALRGMLDAIRKGIFPSWVKAKDKPASVILIGHRVTLLQEAATKLGLRLYLSAGYDEPSSGHNHELKTLAVCLDSLHLFNEPYVWGRDGPRLIYKRDEPHGLVIIDESEQVFSHLVGGTIARGAGIERAFDALKYEVARAIARQIGVLTISNVTDEIRDPALDEWSQPWRAFRDTSRRWHSHDLRSRTPQAP